MDSVKIQLAVDRVTIEEAIHIIAQAKESIDIIEIGTSLFKDYGLKALIDIDSTFDHLILADIKTIDEAEYEFRQMFENGADIATVMGASALETIRICQKTAKKYQKAYMIDTLEMSAEKITTLKEFEDAIICIHLPKDKSGDLQVFIKDFMTEHQFKNKLAVAGGVQLKDISLFKRLGIEIVVIGSSITKSNDIAASARNFKERMK